MGVKNTMIATTSNTKTPRQPTRMGFLLRPPPPSSCAGCCGLPAPPAPPVVCGGGGTGTSASGVGTIAAWWTAAPQFGQNCSCGLSSCPQFLQYLWGVSARSSPLQTQKTFSFHTQSCNHDDMLGRAAHLPEAYSPKCLEGKFSEVDIHDPAENRCGGRDNSP